MKTKLLLFAAFFTFVSLSVNAEAKKKEIKVSGNCGMCEKRIEKAAKSVEGVSVAEWDKTTKKMQVTFDASETTIEKIQKKIADAGHDTGKYTAPDKVYNNLPGCCKYKREKQ